MKELSLVLLGILAIMPSVYAMNLTYNECITISNTTVCAPAPNSATIISANLSYENCTTLFYDNATEWAEKASGLCGDVKTRVQDLSAQFMNTFANLTPNFVTDLIACRTANRDMSEQIDELSVQSINYTACNGELVQYKSGYNQIFQSNQTLTGQLATANNNVNMFALGGFIAGAGLVFVFYRRKSKEFDETNEPAMHDRTVKTDDELGIPRPK